MGLSPPFGEASNHQPFGTALRFDFDFDLEPDLKGQRARTDRRLSASLSSSRRLQNANLTMVRPSSGWSS